MTTITARNGGRGAAGASARRGRSGRARHRHAGNGRARGLPADPQVLGRADPLPLGPRRGDRSRPRPRNRRRRLRHQAVQPARTGGAGQRHPQARRAARQRRRGLAHGQAAARSGAAQRALRRSPSHSPRSSSRSSPRCSGGPKWCSPRAADGAAYGAGHPRVRPHHRQPHPQHPAKFAEAGCAGVVDTVHGVGFRLGGPIDGGAARREVAADPGAGRLRGAAGGPGPAGRNVIWFRALDTCRARWGRSRSARCGVALLLTLDRRLRCCPAPSPGRSTH